MCMVRACVWLEHVYG